MTTPTDATEVLRTALLHLHELLIAYERVAYERIHGRIETPNAMLQLVTSDDAFAWLRPMSMLIVAIDELESPADEDLEDAATIAQRARALAAPLLAPGSAFHARYLEVLQEAPEVIVAHGRVMRALTMTT